MLLHVEICEICIICIKPYKKPLFWVTINDSCMVICDVWRQVPIYSSNWWNRVSSVDRGCSHHHGTIWTIPQRMPQILWKIRQKWRMNRIDLSRNNYQKIRNATEGIQSSGSLMMKRGNLVHTFQLPKMCSYGPSYVTSEKTLHSYKLPNPSYGAPLYTGAQDWVCGNCCDWRGLLLTEAGSWPLIRFTYITPEHSSQHSQQWIV